MPGDRFRDRRVTWGILFVVLLFATAARFYEIGRRSIWFDEGVSVGLARLSFVDLVQVAANSTLGNQILYYLALWAWRPLGDAEWIVRGFSAVCSVATVALVFVLGRRHFGTAAGLSASTLLAFHWLSVRCAQEARGYAFATMLATAAALFLSRYLERGTRNDLAAWILAGGATMYAHAFGLFTIAAQIASLAVLGPNVLRDRKGVFAGAGMLALLVVPIGIVLGNAPPGTVRFVPPVSLGSIEYVATALAGGTQALLWFSAIALSILIVRTVRESSPLVRQGYALCVCWAVLPLLAISAVSLRTPILLDRYVAMSTPAWPLALAATSGMLFRSGSGPRFLLGLAVVAFLSFSEARRTYDGYSDWYEDWRAPAQVVSAEARRGDGIVYESPWASFALEYYLDRSQAQPQHLQLGNLLFNNAFDTSEVAASDRVWVVLSRADRTLATRIQGIIEQTHPRSSPRYATEHVQVFLFER